MNCGRLNRYDVTRCVNCGHSLKDAADVLLMPKWLQDFYEEIVKAVK